MIDPYALLGVSEGISGAELRLRFRELVKQHHPDRGGSPEVFSKIECAYREVLSLRGESNP